MPPEVQHEEQQATEPSLRDALESAFDENNNDSEEREAGRPREDAEKPVRTAKEEPTVTEAAREDGRDEKGRFAPRKSADPAVRADGDAARDPARAPADPAAREVDQFAKPPQSWKPGAREAWSSLPPDVRAEVYRREREAQTVLQQTSQARQLAQHVEQLQQRYSPALAAEGVNVMQATENLMKVSSTLRFGTPLEKAQTAAAIIQQYGVDIVALDHLLANQPPPQQQRPQMMQSDPRVDQLFQRLEQAQRERVERLEQTAMQEVSKFGQDREFFEDVREDMADLLELAAKRGLDLTLEDAYDRACQMNPEIKRVIEARNKAQSAGTSKQSTQRARTAASSVRGTPAQVPSASPSTLREAIEAAIDDSSGR